MNPLAVGADFLSTPWNRSASRSQYRIKEDKMSSSVVRVIIIALLMPRVQDRDVLSISIVIR